MTIMELITSPEPALDIEMDNKSRPYPATRKQLAWLLPKFIYTPTSASKVYKWNTVFHELVCYLKPEYVIPSRTTMTKHMEKHEK